MAEKRKIPMRDTGRNCGSGLSGKTGLSTLRIIRFWSCCCSTQIPGAIPIRRLMRC